MSKITKEQVLKNLDDVKKYIISTLRLLYKVFYRLFIGGCGFHLLE